MNTFIRVVSFLIFTIGVLSCGGDSQNTVSVPDELRSDSSFYFQVASAINVNVYYEETAEPYTGQTPGGLDYWDILFENLTEIFSYRSSSPTLTVPYGLEDMNSLGALINESWTVSDILDLVSTVEVSSIENLQANFSVFFVNGYFADESGDIPNVLGVNLTGSSVIVIFKDVIENSSSQDGVCIFVEQSTMVHEMGHALGFVNGGVPMSSAHQDFENGQHTENSDCVMYYLNEGPADLRQFIAKYILADDITMWGPEVLADAEAFSQ